MKRLVKSVGFAFQGLVEGFRSERNLKIQAGAMLIVIILAALLRLEAWEWVALLVCCALVICLEMINTGIEAIMDHLHPETHDQVRIIKNLSAGAVLFAAFISILVGMIIFFPRIRVFFGQDV